MVLITHLCGYNHLTVHLGLEGLRVPHSHAWQLVLAAGWVPWLSSMWPLILQEARLSFFTTWWSQGSKR